MVNRIFEALVAAAIIAVGSGHTIASIFRGRQEQRRWREAVKRVRFGVSNDRIKILPPLMICAVGCENTPVRSAKFG
jgi:hypothetical protein